MVRPVETLGQRLRAAREQRALSQAGLADMVGIRPHSMWRYESAHVMPSADRLMKLARALSVRVEWLMGGGGPMAQSHPPPSNDDEGSHAA